MLFTRAFPLSLSILWRMALMLPVWIAFYAGLAFGLGYLIYGLLSGLAYSGLIGIALFFFCVSAMFAILTVHPYLIGTRVGLRVLGHQTVRSETRLIMVAVLYGILEAVLLAIVTSITLFLLGMVLSQFTIAPGNLDPDTADPASDLANAVIGVFLGGSNLVLGLSGIFFSLIAFALRAAMLPVFAMHVSAKPGPAPFTSFGGSFWPIMAVLGVITLIPVVLEIALGWRVADAGVGALLIGIATSASLAASGTFEFEFTLSVWLIWAGLVAISLWFFSLACAAAALAEDIRVRGSVVLREQVRHDREAARADAAALLRARMPKRS